MELRWLNKLDGTKALQYRINQMDFTGKITTVEWRYVPEENETTDSDNHS